MNRRGFSLVELTGVVTLVGLLAAILLPSLSRAREAANRASCLNNLVQLGLALHMYAEENEGALPWSGGNGNADCLLQFYTQYLPERQIYACPSDPDVYDEDNDPQPIPSVALDRPGGLRGSYDYLGAYSAAPILIPPLPAPIPDMPVMWDLFSGVPINQTSIPTETMNHIPAGGNVLFLDGHVEFIRAQHWAGSNRPRAVSIETTDPSTAVLYREPDPVLSRPAKKAAPAKP